MPRPMKIDARIAKARRDKALARAELRGPSTPREPASGPISFPIKQRDPGVDRMVEEFLSRRQA